MNRLCTLACLALAVPQVGCQAIAEALADELVASACDEDAGEGRDRRELDRLRDRELRDLRARPLCPVPTPGTSLDEIERRLEREADEAARERFRREHAREPNLNWHAR